MINNNYKFLGLMVLIFLSQMGIAQKNTEWPNYRGNKQLQGYTKNQIPKKVKQSWTFKTASESNLRL